MILFGPSAVSKEISRGPLHSVGGSGLVGHCGKGVLVIDIEFFAGRMVVDVERQVNAYVRTTYPSLPLLQTLELTFTVWSMRRPPPW